MMPVNHHKLTMTTLRILSSTVVLVALASTAQAQTEIWKNQSLPFETRVNDLVGRMSSCRGTSTGTGFTCSII